MRVPSAFLHRAYLLLLSTPLLAFSAVDKGVPELLTAARGLEYAALIMRSPLAPGAPEARDGAAFLQDVPQDIWFFPEALWRRGQLRVLEYTSTHLSKNWGQQRAI